MRFLGRRRRVVRRRRAFVPGRFSASADQWCAVLEALDKKGYVRICGTEGSSRSARVGIERFCEDNGWKSYHPQQQGGSENWVVWNPTAFEFEDGGVNLLTEETLPYGRVAPICSTWVELRDVESNEVDIDEVAHLPAHLAKDAFRRVHESASEGLRGGPRKTLCFDGNRDLRVRRNRQWLKEEWPHMRLAMRIAKMPYGTFGSRIIDVVLVGESVRIRRRPAILWRRLRPGFDHRTLGWETRSG